MASGHLQVMMPDADQAMKRRGILMREELEAFFRDRRLTELCEVLRMGEDILDVISLGENQHSDVLAWLLDPREGHGQGDMIVRDLLLGAYEATEDEWTWLDGRSTTSRFFEEWTPSRIRTANFGSVFVARELGMNAAERVDLFVFDPLNRFVLLIENKAKIAHNSEQLNRYRNSWSAMVAGNPQLRDYKSVYIALDRAFDAEGDKRRPYQGFWLYLGYDWLKSAADRALMQLERGNQAARMVMSYCNRQTDWQSPSTQKALALATALQEAHGPFIKSLLDMSIGRIELQWLEHQHNEEMLFLLQNRSLLSLLRETRGMASVKELLIGNTAGLKRDNVRYARKYLWLCPTGADRYVDDDCWPVYLEVKSFDANMTKFSVTLVFEDGFAATPAIAGVLRQRLASLYDSFNTHTHALRRKVLVGEVQSRTDLAKLVAETSAKLGAALSA